MNSEFTLTQGAGQKLEFAINRNGGDASDIEWLSSGENFKSVIKLARGDAELLVKRTMIRVDRSVKPIYPDWVDKPMHPELEKVGPADFDMSEVEQWLHDGQKTGVVKGQVIYDHLKTNDMLNTCFGLQELQAIQGKGVEFFRKHFAGKAVFGWKSVVLRRGGSLNVPYLIEYGVEVRLHWDWLDYDWLDVDPALRFRK